MRQITKAALLAIFSLAMTQAAQANDEHHGMAMSHGEMAAEQQVVNAKGVVKSIDLENKKITIDHEAIPAINWPPMTMRFTYTELNDSIRSLKVGSAVDFSFIQQGNLSMLQDIKSR